VRGCEIVFSKDRRNLMKEAIVRISLANCPVSLRYKLSSLGPLPLTKKEEFFLFFSLENCAKIKAQ